MNERSGLWMESEEECIVEKCIERLFKEGRVAKAEMQAWKNEKQK